MIVMKRILVILDDDKYSLVRNVKDRLGLTWDELFFESIKAVNAALNENGDGGDED